MYRGVTKHMNDINEHHRIMPVASWTVSDLSSTYINYRESLIRQAWRVLGSEVDANEVVQDAFLKFILAAPELDSSERAIAYLRATVNNLALNLIRAKNSRPNLVAIDSETSKERLSEIAIENHVSIDTSLIAAEDASIIREALSRLSESQRTALVMWEVDNRSTKEIASALGTNEKNVRHILRRARTSFVRVLTEWVVDEETGQTALDLLSVGFRKATKIAKKTSGASLSLVIVLVAFFGFNSVTGNELNSLTIADTFPQKSPIAIHSDPSSSSPLAEIDLSNKKLVSGDPLVTLNPSTKNFVGLSKEGLPMGFTVSNLLGEAGPIGLSSESTITNPDGYILVSYLQSLGSDSVNFLMSQTITFDGSGTSYYGSPSITIAGSWFPLAQKGSSSSIMRLSNGNYLLSATIEIDSTVDSPILMAASGGKDVDAIPSQIDTRIILNSSKSTILAQAVFIGSTGVN